MTYNNTFFVCVVYCVCLRPLCGSRGTTPASPECGGVWAGWVSPCYGGHSVEETPGSIPNPEAKLDCADGTALGRVWESRSPPDIFTGEWRRAGTPDGCSPPPLPIFHARERVVSGAGRGHATCTSHCAPKQGGTIRPAGPALECIPHDAG